ncbi:MAG TPA: NAD(P)/FAD-dependent oxidoreductase [Dyella sp.]|nr:NAD(P)/FAD-dependent oxidoreductase [Dyella sp.]
MLRLTDIKLPLDHAEEALASAIRARLHVGGSAVHGYTIFRRGYDARKRGAIQLIYTLDVDVADEAKLLQRFADDPHVRPTPDTDYRFVAHAPASFSRDMRVAQSEDQKSAIHGRTLQSSRDFLVAQSEDQKSAIHGRTLHRPVVVGMGPCGLFAGLLLAQMGFRPIILERGKAVRERTKDTWDLWRKRNLHPESNVQFGEGGAGTFSDGKLYSQISDPKHYGRKVLTEFVKAGAPEEIIYVSKPHIGTFRLVTMVENMRNTIESLGGEIRFQHRMDDLLVEEDAHGVRHVRGVALANGEQIRTDHVVLALGHSARDTVAMLHERGVYLEAKPFSIGFRVEHPQSMVDQARFGPQAGHPLLGAADFKLVHHCRNGRSVYSFCMCPGGTVVAATSEPGRVVTNGMSQYSRNERNANAAIVVGIEPSDFTPYDNSASPLAGIALQRDLESRAFELGGGTYEAPGQLIGDFLAGRASTALGEVMPSYKPGVRLTDLATALPDYAIEAIREAMPAFDRKLKGFARPDAIFTGVETRTSSPVRIRRNDDDLQSLNTRGLFPAGEGAGYAGGILSAGVDGIRIAEAVALSIAHQAAHAY